MISLLVAHDSNRVIGKDNQLPWHIPEDLKYFKEKTMGKGIVMGRKTFESIGRPLPGRKNIVLTRKKDYEAPGAEVVHSLDDGIRSAAEQHQEIMIIGGAELFKETLPIADRLYVTYIDRPFEGDTYFPPYGKEEWTLVSSSEKHQTSGIPYSFLVYERQEGQKARGSE
ncbi:dihydrofolate reductase [Indiicoccus explosivorum]|uniref:dihydrofolate reductase n=1 Tax=Indiicoccus explosivorum TaxID=1917864 RepID=UPI000B4548E4|nr:dihydrofolate reductase [Indiicoccus explosivorum]